MQSYGSAAPKVICVGLNYRDHANEAAERLPQAPLLFGKFANTLIGSGETIVLPPEIGHVDAEAELAIVIANRVARISEADALEAVAGYACANDISARDAQFGDGQWFRGKSLDTFCPVGPRVVPRAELDVTNLRITQRLNGQSIQDGSTADLIFGIAKLVSYASHGITLERGDLILTGTPHGVGVFRDPKITLAHGDVVEVEIEGIGVLRNRVCRG